MSSPITRERLIEARDAAISLAGATAGILWFVEDLFHPVVFPPKLEARLDAMLEPLKWRNSEPTEEERQWAEEAYRESKRVSFVASFCGLCDRLDALTPLDSEMREQFLAVVQEPVSIGNRHHESAHVAAWELAKSIWRRAKCFAGDWSDDTKGFRDSIIEQDLNENWFDIATDLRKMKSTDAELVIQHVKIESQKAIATLENSASGKKDADDFADIALRLIQSPPTNKDAKALAEAIILSNGKETQKDLAVRVCKGNKRKAENTKRFYRTWKAKKSE